VLVFALLLLLHVVLPLFHGRTYLDLIAGLGFIAVLSSTGWIVLATPRARRRYLGAVAISMIMTISLTLESRVIGFAWVGFNGLLFAYTSVIVIRWTLQRERVTQETIFAALSGHYLMGFTWALIYLVVDGTVAGAFNVAPGETLGFGSALYFSFVTLMTLGYGDLTATAPLSRALATSEALVGQVYLTVLLARLVSVMVNQDSADVEGERRV
jgi:hypothetical protein